MRLAECGLWGARIFHAPTYGFDPKIEAQITDQHKDAPRISIKKAKYSRFPQLAV